MKCLVDIVPVTKPKEQELSLQQPFKTSDLFSHFHLLIGLTLPIPLGELSARLEHFRPCAATSAGRYLPAMLSTIFFHPFTTFIAGILATLAVIGFFIGTSSPPNQSAQKITTYHDQLTKHSTSPVFASEVQEQAAIERFKSFLQGIGNAEFIKRETLNIYSADAYLDDTLVIHHGAAAIQDYFAKTAKAMTSCHVTIDDVSKSGKNYYVRWTMAFAAPALSGGEKVHSIGISQVCFDREGKVTFHQDFWDAGQNFFGHLPIVKGAIGFVRGRIQ